MADLLALSTRILDEGLTDEPTNRITHELSELADDIAIVEAFSHSISFRTEDGLVVFDTSGVPSGDRVVKAIRGWSHDRFSHLVYTHGHIDHVGGCGAFLADAENRSDPVPEIIAHENVPERFDRYDLTNGYNLVINSRQFRGFVKKGYGIGGKDNHFLPKSTRKPNITYRKRLNFSVGGLEIELRHARGETDDHTWAWIPQHKTICAGDFFIWNFPNAGNPQKVQRYPREWAVAMREMAKQGAELFIPAHGLPISGKQRIRAILIEVAETLEKLVSETLAMMNEGARLNDIIHSVKVAPELLERPYLRPLYDEPEFVVRNIWRMYGGWYDGNPSQLKPAKDGELASELADLSGGARNLAERAQKLAESDQLRLACHLIELATLAEPENKSIHSIRAEIYQQRRRSESSLMAKGIFGYASAESLDAAGEVDPYRD